MTTQEILQFAVNVALVLITGVYVVLTFKILRASQRSVEVMERQTDSLTRPYIVADVFCNRGENYFRLRIRNLGSTAAQSLRLTLDRAFYRNGERTDEHNVATYDAFTRPIPMFAPKAELVFNLGATFQIFRPEHSDTMPSRFQVKARYEYAGIAVEETNEIDLRMYYLSAVNPDNVVSALKDIAVAITKSKA